MNAKQPFAEQERLLAFLLNPKSYPHQTRTVRLVSTHASLVFLTPPFVYKIKRPVDFDFLDFSTLEKRKHFCEREVILNRRLAPSIYLGVVPIHKTAEGFAFGAGADVVEYAIKMRKLSDGHFLDQILARGEVSQEHLDRVVALLERVYREQEPKKEIEAWGRVNRLQLSTGENFRQVRRFVGLADTPHGAPSRARKSSGDNRGPSTLSRAAFRALRFYTERFYTRQAKVFLSRIRDKRIRDCHGDLHLEHVHITPHSVNIFDCIEFNDRFRYVDVANDAAFLAMDLDFEGRPDLARYFASRMAGALKDEGMPRLMDFYKCYRAMVRGKVESLQSLSAPASERPATIARAQRYFRLALSYTVAGSRPLVLVVMGGIATGKSTLANALAAELGWEVYSSDRLRKDLARLPLHERASASVRKRLYSAAMTQKTYRNLCACAEAQVRGGHSVVLDATFSRAEHRALLAHRLDTRGIAWCMIEVRASRASVKRRLLARAASSGVVSDARLEDLAWLRLRVQPPVELDSRQRVIVHAHASLDRTLRQALERLASRQIDLA